MVRRCLARVRAGGLWLRAIGQRRHRTISTLFAGAATLAAALAVSLGLAPPAHAQVSALCAFADGRTVAPGGAGDFVLAGPAPGFSVGERLTITRTAGVATTWRLEAPTGNIVVSPQPTTTPLIYRFTTPGTLEFRVIFDGAINFSVACGFFPFSPTEPGALDALGSATGFAAIGNLNEGLQANVRTRFFGGEQAAGNGFAFQLASAYRASSLSQRADARTKVALTPEGRLRWSVWFKGTGTYLDNSNATSGYDGTLFSLTGGIDYLITDNILAGLLFGYEDFKLDTVFNNGAFDGNGFSVGPYVGIRFLRHFLFEGLFAYTWLNTDVRGTSLTTTGSGNFDSARWMTSASLSGHWQFKKRIRFSPKIRVVYAEEDREAFTNSAGLYTAGGRIKLGRFSFGPEIGVTVYRKGRSYIEPYVSLTGQYDFENQGEIVLASGAVIPAQKRLSARVGFGVNARLNRNLHARLGASYDGIGRANFSAWTGELRIRLRW